MSAAIDYIDATPRVTDTLDAVYRLDLDPLDWLGLLCTSLNGDNAGLVRVGRDGNGEIVALHADERAEALLRSYCPQNEAGNLMPPVPFPGVLSTTQSEAMGFPFSEPFKSAYARAGVKDSFVVSGLSPCGVGVVVGRTLVRRSSLTTRARRYWNAVAIHLSASVRLRTAIASSIEAVLAPDGRLLHSEGIAANEEHREALRRAAQAIDRARTTKDDPVAAIESWSALVDGRWSLVDEFERDGRHFLVARVNEPSVSGSPALSPRERQVAALAALGRCNKQIAYELGLKLASVSSYLKRARQKLGADNRAELISRF